MIALLLLTFNHMLYMDDLKLHTRNSNEISSLLHCVHIFSDDIFMSFGINKCASISIYIEEIKGV